MLVKRFGFAKTNVDLFLDENATRKSIYQTFLRYADATKVGQDDRIMIFFAGHGYTVKARRGEIGYLVPFDGDIDDLSTLIRWDNLTRNADLVQAKHMLFLMDACYGGLALARAPKPGSGRFLHDMLQRYTRQVLTAGKGDELVSDSGGTRHGHSIFTSYLLDGIEGAAVPAGGILTGSGLMAYVYDKVGSDPQSRQTPHYGFFDGDGDFIFDARNSETISKVSLRRDPCRMRAANASSILWNPSAKSARIFRSRTASVVNNSTELRCKSGIVCAGLVMPTVNLTRILSEAVGIRRGIRMSSVGIRMSSVSTSVSSTIDPANVPTVGSIILCISM